MSHPWQGVGLDEPERPFPPKPIPYLFVLQQDIKNPNQLFSFQLLIILGLHFLKDLILPYFLGILEGLFSSPPLSPSKAFNQCILLTPWFFSCLWNTRPLNQDFPSYPRLFNRPGRSEKFIEKPCGICWKICPLLPLFLTFSFCSISPHLVFSHLPHPPSRLRQKLLHACEERLGILSESCRGTKISLLASFHRAPGVHWSYRDVQTPSTGVSWSCFSFFRARTSVLGSTFVFPPPPIIFWSIPVGIV